MILMQLRKNVNYLPSAWKGLYGFLLENIFILGLLKFFSIFNYYEIITNFFLLKLYMYVFNWEGWGVQRPL